MLYGLAALSVPIIIHLVSRFFAKKYEFPTIRFLEQLKAEATKMEKLRHLLLLIARILLLALIVAGFSRPFLAKKGGKWTAGSTKAAAIIIDNSYSMSYKNNFKLAKEEAKKIINSLETTDKVVVISSSNKPKIILGLSLKSSYDNSIVDRLNLSAKSTEFEPAIKLAEETLLETPAAKKIIYLVSDNQEAGWLKYNLSEKLAPGVEFKIQKVSGENGANIIAENVELSSESGKYFYNKLIAKVLNYCEDDKTVEVELNIDGNIIKKNQTLKPLQAEDVEFDVNIKLDKPHLGQVKISDDGLMQDNIYYFCLNKSDQLPLLAITDGDEKDLLYLKKALNPLNVLNLFDVKTVSSFEAAKEDLEKFKAVLLINVIGLKDEMISNIKSFIEKGGGVVFVAGDKVILSNYNTRKMKEIMPANFLNIESKGIGSKFGSGIVLDMFESDILAGLTDLKYANWTEINTYKYIKMSDISGSIIMSYENGDPALLEKRTGKGRLVVFTSSFDGYWNNFVITPIFLPFVHQLIYSLSNVYEKQDRFIVGEYITVSDEKTDRVYDPNNKELKAGTETEIPGIYKIVGKDKQEEFVAINVNSTEEGNLIFSEKNEAEFKLNNPSNEFGDVKGRYNFWTKKEQEEQQRWWWYFIIAAIIIGTVEMMLANYKISY